MRGCRSFAAASLFAALRQAWITRRAESPRPTAGLDYGCRVGITLYASVLQRTDFGVGVRGRLNHSYIPRGGMRIVAYGHVSRPRVLFLGGRGVKKTCRWHVFSLRPQRLCREEGTWIKGAPFFFGKKNGSPFAYARCVITPHQSAARTASPRGEAKEAARRGRRALRCNHENEQPVGCYPYSPTGKETSRPSRPAAGGYSAPGLDTGRRAGITLYAFVLCRTDFGWGQGEG